MQANIEHATRQLLSEWQADDGVDAHKTGLQDPPLLALEIEAADAQLMMLKQTFADSASNDDAEGKGTALLEACMNILSRFESTDTVASVSSEKV